MLLTTFSDRTGTGNLTNQSVLRSQSTKGNWNDLIELAGTAEMAKLALELDHVFFPLRTTVSLQNRLGRNKNSHK